jgi:hypothetical protein
VVLFPELAGILQQYRQSALTHNDPVSTADVLRQSMDSHDSD